VSVGRLDLADPVDPEIRQRGPPDLEGELVAARVPVFVDAPGCVLAELPVVPLVQVGGDLPQVVVGVEGVVIEHERVEAIALAGIHRQAELRAGAAGHRVALARHHPVEDLRFPGVGAELGRPLGDAQIVAVRRAADLLIDNSREVDLARAKRVAVVEEVDALDDELEASVRIGDDLARCVRIGWQAHGPGSWRPERRREHGRRDRQHQRPVSGPRETGREATRPVEHVPKGSPEASQCRPLW
jgi:hypothetical protein